jgi:hypothetical protein
VQYLDSGRGAWRAWLSRVAGTSAPFTGMAGHRYSFRCRAIDNANNTGSYPPGGDTATLIGTRSGLPNLRVTGLTAAPNPGGGVWVEMTIHNEGDAATPGGVHADLYLDHVPDGVGDYAGSVHTWVTEPMPAGATRTLTAALSQGIGEDTGSLYALVDSIGVVGEADEGDNRHTAGVPVCLAAEDSYEDDDSPTAAKPLSPGASQARNFGGPGDRDWIRLDALFGRMYHVTTLALGPGVDTRLTVFTADGARLLGMNDDAGATTLASQLIWTPPVSGPYVLMVDAWNPATGGCGAAYTISLADAGPAHSLFLPLVTQ